MTHYLSDVRNVGIPVVVFALAFVTPIALVHLWERSLGRRSRAARLFAIAYFAVLAVFALGEFSAGAMALFCVAQLGAFAVEMGEAARAKRLARKGRGPRLVPLSGAISPAIVGAKAYWLGRLANDGMTVPEGVVLLARPNESIDGPWLERAIEKRLGDGPLIVRSTAPDEDEEGSLTAGRYLSVAIGSASEVANAVRAVFDDYVAKGVDGDVEVAVLIQHRLDAPWAGIAVRAPMHRGGGIVVECSRGSNVAITAGERAECVGVIGAVSKTWLDGHNAPPIPAQVLVEVFERYEVVLGGAVQIEWAWDGKALTLFQVRRAPKEAAPPLPMDDAASVLSRMRTSLEWMARRPSATVLEVGELGDYRQGTSRATEELFAAMWARDGGHRHALRMLGVRVFPKPPKPLVVRVEGSLFQNLVSDVPIRQLLALPFHRWGRLLLKARMRSRLARLRAVLDRLAKEPVARGDSSLQSPQDAARRILDLRKRIVEGPGAMAVAVALLEGAWRGKRATTPRVAGDPLLLDLAAGMDLRDVAKRHPRRAIPDLVLERPRLGEGLGPIEAPAHAEAVPEASPKTIDDQLAFLRGRARVLLADYAAELRSAYLQLGRLLGQDDVFELTEAMLENLASGNAASLPPIARGEGGQPVPLRVSLLDLERWASFGTVAMQAAGEVSNAAFWVGDPAECECVVVHPNEAAPCEARPLVVVDVPTVDLLASVAKDVVVVARGGTRLCHAAMIARERGIAALFGAGDAVAELAPGDRVRVRKEGRVEKAALAA